LDTSTPPPLNLRVYEKSHGGLPGASPEIQTPLPLALEVRRKRTWVESRLVNKTSASKGELFLRFVPGH
jgi:hypothetical protein